MDLYRSHSVTSGHFYWQHPAGVKAREKDVVGCNRRTAQLVEQHHAGFLDVLSELSIVEHAHATLLQAVNSEKAGHRVVHGSHVVHAALDAEFPACQHHQFGFSRS